MGFVRESCAECGVGVCVYGKKVKAARARSGGSNSGDSDDDFVAPPLPFVARVQEVPMSKAPGGDLTVDEDVAIPRKDDIREMGFAALLDFNVNECPPRLVYWLLSNFDGETRVFDLGGGRSLALEERDVELVLGFPRGPIEMVKRDRGKFEKRRHQVTATAISSEMVSLIDGGLWFRMHFCMLVLSTFVACMRNGYANQMYFHHFDDVKRIQDLNWCKLLVDSLVETQAAWKSGSHKCFVGPAEFVAFLYVDRVLHFARPVSRVVPACRGWSLELLQQRELSEIRLGGFGHSVIELPLFDGRNVDSGAGHPQGSDDVVGGCSS
nr:uncharacterized protein LOC109193148 isoform X1 [Ipomoea batatas]